MFIGCLLRRTFELRPCCGSVVVTGLRRSSVDAVGVPKDFFLSMDEVFCADMAFFTPFPWFFSQGDGFGRSVGWTRVVAGDHLGRGGVWCDSLHWGRRDVGVGRFAPLFPADGVGRIASPRKNRLRTPDLLDRRSDRRDVIRYGKPGRSSRENRGHPGKTP